jgi:S-adenosylmethionine decarboxylase
MIDMKILKGPIVVAGLPGNPGWTGFVIIEKSHISIHTFKDGNKVSLDVFSCKTIPSNRVEEIILKMLPIKHYNLQILERNEEKK